MQLKQGINDMNDAAASPLPGTRAANPLLDFSDLPRFGDFTPDAITPAVEVLLADARAAIALCLIYSGLMSTCSLNDACAMLALCARLVRHVRVTPGRRARLPRRVFDVGSMVARCSRGALSMRAR